MQVELNRTLAENTDMRSYLKDLIAQRKRLTEDKEKFVVLMKEKFNYLEKELLEC